MNGQLIGIVTEMRYIDPSKMDQYVSNILEDERLIQASLEAKGYRAIRVAWDDTNVDWSTFDAIIIRSTWNYFYHIEDFKKWLTHAASKTLVINDAELIKWNIDKSYLFDLEQNGIRIPASVKVPKGTTASLQELCKLHFPDQDIVIKPTVGGGAHITHYITQSEITSYIEKFKGYISAEDMIIQKFQKNVVTQGELSLVYISGEYTHAVLKKAKKGDFRVQDDFGGTVHVYQPSSEVLAFANETIDALDTAPVYARVDIIFNDDMQPCITELELIEPELWFRQNPKSADALAESIAERLA